MNAFQDVAATSARELIDTMAKMIDDGVEVWQMSLRHDFHRGVEMCNDPRHVVFAEIVNRRPLKDSLAKKLYLGRPTHGKRAN